MDVAHDDTTGGSARGDLRLALGGPPQALFDDAPLGIALCDTDGGVLRANRAFCELVGRDESDLVGSDFRAFRAGDLLAPAGELHWCDVTRLWTAAERQVAVRLRVRPVRDPFGEATGAIAYASLGTSAAESETEHPFRQIAENGPDVLYRLRLLPEPRLEYVSPAITTITGFETAALYADPGLARAVVYPDPIPEFDDGPAAVTMRWIRHDGSTIWSEHRVHPVHDDAGQTIAVDGVARDVTAREIAEADLVRRALHDPLTLLANRALMLEHLDRAIRSLTRRGDMVGLLYIDLDGFKNVNDTLGHTAGDRVLVTVAHRLQRAVRPGDTVARLGGDEFVVVLPQLRDPTEAVPVAERVHEELDSPIDVGGSEVNVTASIGVASVGDPATPPEELVRLADIAMYQGKRRGRGRIDLFDDAMQARADDRHSSARALRTALSRRELRVHYQPEVDLVTGRVVGVEALARWAHPRRGLLAAAEFVDLAEELGLTPPIGRWMLREVCRQWARWRAERPAGELLGVSVNLSPRQLVEPDLVALVHDALAEWDLPPSGLRLEVKETTLMADPAFCFELLGTLRASGVQMAIDDFGAGSSTLATLIRLPFDAIKIDRTFVAALGENAEADAMVAALVRFGDDLGITVVGEGIETPQQLDALADTGCRVGQGYLLAGSSPGPEIGALLGVDLRPGVRRV